MEIRQRKILSVLYNSVFLMILTTIIWYLAYPALRFARSLRGQELRSLGMEQLLTIFMPACFSVYMLFSLYLFLQYKKKVHGSDETLWFKSRALISVDLPKQVAFDKLLDYGTKFSDREIILSGRKFPYQSECPDVKLTFSDLGDKRSEILIEFKYKWCPLLLMLPVGSVADEVIGLLSAPKEDKPL